MGHSLGEYGALVAAGVPRLRGGARGRERAGIGDGLARLGGQRRHGGGLRSPRGDRAGRRHDRRQRRHRQHQQLQPGGRRRSDPSGRSRGPGLHGAGHQRGAAAGEPRLPHLDRRPGERAPQGGVASPRPPRPGAAGRLQRDRRLLPGGRRHRDDARPPRPAGRLAGAVRPRTAHALRRGCAGVRRGGSEEGAAGLRRRRPGRPRRRARALHQPPQERRPGLVQRGDVRALGSRSRIRCGAWHRHVGRR